MRHETRLPTAPLWPLVVVLCAASLALYLWHNGFPLGMHPDEEVKVGFIKDGGQNFLHPILLLHLGRLAAWLSGAATDFQVVLAGRGVSAVMGMLCVAGTWLLARRVLPDWAALSAAALAAATPMLAVHAHFLKEDIYVGGMLMLFLAAYAAYLQRPEDRGRLLAAGALLGLACSAKYPAVLAAVVMALTPWLANMPDKGRRYRDMGLMLLVGAAVFALVNYPLFTQFEVFHKGLSKEYLHTVRGHRLKVWAWDHFFAHHLVHSLGPGMGWPLLLAGVIGLVLAHGQRRMAVVGPVWTALFLFVLVFYLAPELSPNKPFRGSVRYVLPVVPVFCVFAALALERLHAVGFGRRVPGGLLALLLVASPLWLTAGDVAGFGRDSHDLALAWVRQRQAEGKGPVFVEKYASAVAVSGREAGAFTPRELRERGYSAAVVSDVNYARYFKGLDMDGQRESVSVYAANYAALFGCPRTVMGPVFRSFSYLDPQITAVDLAACLDLPAREGP